MSSKASGKGKASASRRTVRSNVFTTEALSKSPSDAPHMSADAGHTNLSSSSCDDGPPLHFFGLAVTQTQTQQVASSAEATGEIGESTESRVCICSSPTLLHSPNRCLVMIAETFLPLVQVAKRRKLSHDPKVHSSPKAPIWLPDATSGAGPMSRSASKSKRRRSPSPASTDSFAMAEEWEDPAKVFLASNAQFEVPLSELGRRSTQKKVREGYDSMARTPLRHTSQEPTQVDRLRISGATNVQQPGVQTEDVLLPMSNVSTDAQPRNLSSISDIPDDASTPPVMSNPGLMDNLDTRTEDYQATQPVTSEDLDMGNTQVSDATDLCPRQPSPQAWSSTVSKPSTNTRNILSLVNPAKKWRLQRGEQLLQAALQTGSDGQTQPPAVISELSTAPSTGRLLFEQLAAQMRAGQQLPRHDLQEQDPPILPPLEEDSRETAVVPDSEPPEPANTASTLARPHSSIPPNNSLGGGRVDSPLSCLSPAPSVAPEDEDLRHDKEKDGQSDGEDEDDIPLFLTMDPKAREAPPSAKRSKPPKVQYCSHSRLLALLITISQSKAKQSRALEGTKRVVGTKASSTRGVHTRVTEIPSSVPEQDHRHPAVPPTPQRTGPSRKGKEREDTRKDAFIPSVRSGQVTPTPDDAATEPADDLLPGNEDHAAAPQGSKVLPKFGRLHSAFPRKAAYRSASRATNNTLPMVSGSRSTKRSKNHPIATRVFALWKQDAAYFSGIVCDRAGQPDRFRIQFDDGDEDVVDLRNLRWLEFQIGDRVTIIDSQEKATIVNVDKQQYSMVTVQLIDDPAVKMEVEVFGIKIQSRAVKSQWGNRMVNADEIVTVIPITKSETPSSLRNSSTSLGRKVLNKVGIVVTLSVGCDREKEKEAIMRIIKTNGGTVLDDWSDVFSLAGEYSTNKKRWVITSDNVCTDRKHDIQQVFLVSDAPNTKPRFLTALALGVPCLSVDWLRALSSGVSFAARFD